MSVVQNCTTCDAHCCRHVAVQIGKPRTKKEYDHIRWYLLHDNIWVSIDLQGNWLLEFRSPCKNITADFKCNDYENRPTICKEYPSEEELCERQSEDLAYTQLFKCVEDFEQYLMTTKPTQIKQKSTSKKIQ